MKFNKIRHNNYFLLIFLLLSTIIITFFLTTVKSKEECVMTSPNFYYPKDKSHPNLPNKNPFQLSKKYADMLAETCGKEGLLFNPYGNVCCNTTQVEDMKKRLFLIDIEFFKCPACAQSFKRIFCDYACSPQQYKFVEIEEMWDKDDPNLKGYVKSTFYTLTENFLNNFWQSCKDNIIGVVKIKAKYGNAKTMLTSLIGQKKSNPTLKLKFNNDKEHGYEGHPIPCEKQCVCAYCDAACRNEKPINPDFTCRIYGIKCSIAGGLLFTAVIVLFILAMFTSLFTFYLKPGIFFIKKQIHSIKLIKDKIFNKNGAYHKKLDDENEGNDESDFFGSSDIEITNLNEEDEEEYENQEKENENENENIIQNENKNEKNIIPNETTKLL